MTGAVSYRLSRLEDLLDPPTVQVGSVVSMTYTDAIIVTNDFRVEEAGGLPQRGFLLAVPPTLDGTDLKEAILLSVTGTAPLSVQRDFLAVREDMALNGREEALDPRTRANLEHIGLSCRVVGTFHRTPDGVKFGADMDRIRGNSSYRVVKPMGRALGLIGSYARTVPDDRGLALPLGVVRYTETQVGPDFDAKIFVDLNDFLAKKTGVFGMSRTGKALTEDTLIPVPVSRKFPTGWARNDELSVGDEVFSSSGKPVPVISLTDWEVKPVFEVKLSDGQVIKTAGDHLWSATNLTRYHARKAPYRAEKIEARARKTAQVTMLRELASSFESTTYASLSYIAEISSLSVGQLAAAAKASGIEKQLGVSYGKYGLMPKRVKGEDNLYPVAELLMAAAARRANAGIPKNRPATTMLVTTEDIAADTKPGKSSWGLELCGLSLPAQNLPIDPYVLGYWLGDGTSLSGDVAVDDKPHSWSPTGESDKESFIANVERAGYTVKTYPHAPMRVHVNGLYTLLRQSGILGNKHIPIQYLRSSREQRLALLQGLMDSDGSAGQEGGQGLGFSNEELAVQTVELIRSLGIAATMKKKPTAYTHKETRERISCKPSYSITFNTAVPVFRLARKLARQESRVGHRLEINRIVAVRKIEAGRVRCLTVDSPDSLHLVEGFVPTHNSNTMKIICQKTFEHGKITGKKTGQIIFDPQGEYANATKQDVSLEDDASALANIGTDDEVRIYKMLKDSENEGGKLRHLQLNLMDEDNVEFMWSLMLRNLSSGASAGTNYIASLESQKFYRPGRQASSDKQELWDRQLLGVYGLVGASLAETHALKRPLDLYFSDHAVEMVTFIDHLTHGKTDEHVLVENTDDAYAVLEFLIDNEDKLNSSIRKELKKGILTPFKEQILAQREGRNGVVAAFRRVMPFHNERARGDVREKIWADMKAGRLVMVDLSKGNPRTVTSLSELIAAYLIKQSSENFTAGNENVHYQIVVEEAHNLFGSTESEEYTPWVRISKEGAKYGIGLVYATQEVTGVDHRILANTANFVVSHLSSTTETNQLAKYYSFGEWSDHLMRVETKGFVRLKTESSPYIVPVQIDKFEVNVKNEMDSPVVEATPARVVPVVEDQVDPVNTSAYSDEDYDNALF